MRAPHEIVGGSRLDGHAPAQRHCGAEDESDRDGRGEEEPERHPSRMMDGHRSRHGRARRGAVSPLGDRRPGRSEQGTSLNALIRDYIEGLAGHAGGDEILSEFEAMWAEPGSSGGKPFKREELYDERLNRYAPR